MGLYVIPSPTGDSNTPGRSVSTTKATLYTTTMYRIVILILIFLQVICSETHEEILDENDENWYSINAGGSNMFPIGGLTKLRSEKERNTVIRKSYHNRRTKRDTIATWTIPDPHFSYNTGATPLIGTERDDARDRHNQFRAAASDPTAKNMQYLVSAMNLSYAK